MNKVNFQIRINHNVDEMIKNNMKFYVFNVFSENKGRICQLFNIDIVAKYVLFFQNLIKFNTRNEVKQCY